MDLRVRLSRQIDFASEVTAQRRTLKGAGLACPLVSCSFRGESDRHVARAIADSGILATSREPAIAALRCSTRAKRQIESHTDSVREAGLGSLKLLGSLPHLGQMTGPLALG